MIHRHAREDACRHKWRIGDLRFMLRKSQLAAYDFFKEAPEGVDTVLCMHRGSGKTYLEAVCASEFAQTRSGSTVHFIGQTRQDALEYVLPIFEKVFDSAYIKGSERPKWDASSNCFEFPNRSRILIYGGDIRSDKKRGRDVDAAFVDEVAFYANAETLINDVLLPRILLYGGKLMLASTPPKSVSHPYAHRVREAEKRGNLFKYTVEDNPLVTAEQIELFAAKSGGRESTTFRREYLCELVTDERYAVFPEFSRATLPRVDASLPTQPILGVSCDFSGVTGGVLVNHDKNTNKLVCLDSFSLKKASVEQLKAHIAQTVQKSGAPADALVYCRASMAVIDELSASLPFPILESRKPNLSEDTALIKSIITLGRLEVDNKCPNVSEELVGAVWADSRKDFDTNGYGGKFDLIKALCTLSTEFPQITAKDGSFEDEHMNNQRVFAGMSGDSSNGLVHLRPHSLLESYLQRKRLDEIG